MAPSPDKTPFAGQGLLSLAEVEDRTATRCLLTCRYDVSAYRDADFAHFGVSLPAFLSRAVDKRRAEFLAGRVLAKQALHLLDQPDIPVGRGVRGEPLWPSGITGSISHSHGLAAVWLGTDGTLLGLDIEALADDRAARAIRHSVVTEADRVLLGPDPDAATCTAVFSAKEALYKALFPAVRRFFGFDYAEVTEFHPGRTQLRIAKPLAAGFDVGRTIDIHQHWKAGSAISRCEIDP